jgi:serine phosphatase RsbU (regulator of sigma subunit)
MKRCYVLLLLLTIAALTVSARQNPDALSKINIDSLESIMQSSKGDKHKLANIYEKLGNIFYANDDGENALRNYQEALKLYEELGDTKGAATLYSNIGEMYFDQSNYVKALDYLRKSLTNQEKLADQSGIVRATLKMAEVYAKKGDIRTAREYNLKALEMAETLDDEKLVGNALSNLGDVFVSLEDYQGALQYTLRSLEIKRGSGDKNGMAHVLTTMGSIYTKLGQYDKATTYFQEGLKIAQAINARQLELNLYFSLFEYHELKGDFKKALDYHKDYVILKDSLYNIARDKQLSELSVRYESSKKEKENLALQQKVKEDQTSIQGRNQLLIAAGIGLLVVLVLLGLIYRDNQKIKQQNTLLKKDEIEIKRKNEELERQRAEIDKRQAEIVVQNTELEKRQEEIEEKSEQLGFAYNEINNTNAELREQKAAIKQQNVELSHKNFQITESIRYAKDIQEVFLPSEQRMQEALGEYFVLSKPKEIVSGDFYWLSQKENNGGKKTILITADCTGHGVPGALVSTIGGSILNQLINERGMTEPSEILYALNDSFVEVLQQEQSNIGDSMDISLCIIDHENRKVAFAGAKTPVFYVQNGEIHEIKGNPRHIGGLNRQRKRNVSFTTTEFDISTPTMLYMISDGYYHQFGGLPFRKFMRDSFKNLLLEISTESLEIQKQTLETTLNDWVTQTDASVSPFPQIDDILIVGVKL